MTPPPVVTGLSPNEGPPGTRIKIRGEYFGSQPSDLIGLTVCGVDCLLSAEWKSPNKIIAISGPIRGEGDVIVTTKYGGKGICTVTFKGNYSSTIGPLKESAVWLKEMTTFSWGTHSLSPTSFQQEDPLGLSIEESENKISEEELQTFFPGKCGDLTTPNFSSGWFLLENHQSTSFNDLKAGLIHLKRKIQSQKEGQLSFLKANISSIIDQVDTLVNLRERYEKDLPEFGNEPTMKLEKAIKESEADAMKLFDDVLARKDKAEKTRNALNVLTRFKFLFCLPCVIERNVRKGEYDIVINDYMRVKNLFHKTDIEIFKEALKEIENRIVDLQKKLHTDLQTMPITVEQQKRLIRYLVNLDSPYDAAWDAISSRCEFINNRFKEIYSYHKMTDKSESTKKSNSAAKYSKYSTPQIVEVNLVPACINFTDEICVMTSEVFPDLWKIGQAYFSGELQVKVEAGRQVEYKHMVMSVIETFCKHVRASLIPNTLDKTERGQFGSLTTPERDEIAIYLPEMLRSVRSTYMVMIKLDLPSETLDMIGSLLLDLRIHCMSILFQQTMEQIKQLPEDWKISFSGKYTGITDLPLKFLQLIEDVIQIVKESVLSAEQRETSLLENAAAKKELEKQLDGIFTAFHGLIYNLSSDEDYDDCEDNSPVVSQLIGTPVNSHKANGNHQNVPVLEHRLLIMLSNCIFTKNTILDVILAKFKENAFPSVDIPINNAKAKLDDLEKSILEQYLEQKSDPLVGTIEPSMYLGLFDWDTNVAPTDVRPYAKECLNNLISVHSEIINITSSLLNTVLSKIVETIAEEIYRLMVCVKKFSKEGAQQATLDIRALMDFFDEYTSNNTRTHFKEALDVIPRLEISEMALVEDILKQCKGRMRTQYLCLRKRSN